MIPNTLLQEIQNAHPGYVTHWVYLEHGSPTMVVSRYDTLNAKQKSLLQNSQKGVFSLDLCDEKKERFSVRFCLRKNPFSDILWV
jgi:hypothetical protein